MSSFFDDSKRREIRVRQNTGFFTDYLVRSECSDYYNLRLVVNTVVGIIVCSSLYHAGWNSLNFGDFDYTYGLVIKWLIVLITAYAFAISPIFRCALFCVLVAAFGKQGQYPFTMLVVSNLHEGPISNMLSNYETTADIVVCHIDLQSKIVANRVALLTGPLEELVEKMMAKGTRAMKIVSRETRALISPFLEQLQEEKSKTDDKDEIERGQVEDIEKRRQKMLKLWEKSMGRQLTEEDEIANELLPSDEIIESVNIEEEPVWKRFKTPFAQRFGAKMTAKCEEMFNKGIEKCKELSGDIVQSCKNAIIWPIEIFICPRLNIENVCNSVERRVQSINLCRSELEKVNVDPSMENDLADVMNLTNELEQNSKIGLHNIRVETPRIETEYRLSDLKIQIRRASMLFKNIMGVLKQLCQVFFIYFLYTIFRDSVDMIRKYRDDVSFNNCFLTKDFWLIDKYRLENGQTHISRFTKNEIREWGLLEVFGMPTKTEHHKAIRPFFKWFALVLTVCLIILMDYYLFTFLDAVIESAQQQVKQQAKSSAGLKVTGEGVFADFLKTMTTSNETLEIDQTLTNEHCLIRPLAPDTQILIYWLVIPLILSFVFQVVFSFAIRRIILNYFLPFVFPKRSRVRLIHLYNKCLTSREKLRKEARARIRFMTERKRLEVPHDGSFLSAGSFFKRQIFDRTFRTARCILCSEKTFPRKLQYCSDIKCQSSYCSTCIEDNYGKCYACMVIKKEVSEDKSKLLAPREVNELDTFIDYDELFEKQKQLV